MLYVCSPPALTRKNVSVEKADGTNFLMPVSLPINVWVYYTTSNICYINLIYITDVGS